MPADPLSGFHPAAAFPVRYWDVAGFHEAHVLRIGTSWGFVIFEANRFVMSERDYRWTEADACRAARTGLALCELAATDPDPGVQPFGSGETTLGEMAHSYCARLVAEAVVDPTADQ